jgi:hypothetical protein
MANSMDLMLAWMRGCLAAADSVTEANFAALRELMPLPKRQFEAAADAMQLSAEALEQASARVQRKTSRTGRTATASLRAVAGNKPASPRRRPGRPRKRAE